MPEFLFEGSFQKVSAFIKSKYRKSGGSMREVSLSIICAAMLLASAVVAGATSIFADNFDSENSSTGAKNYTGFKDWSVTKGSVDLIGNGFFDFVPGNGLYVDMDGSTNAAGTMTTESPFALDPGTYTLSFKLAGNHRTNDPEQVSVNVGNGLFNKSYSLAMDAGFTPFSETFIINAAQAASISFQGFGSDKIGMLLDDVSFQKGTPDSVPEPPTLILLAAGLIGLVGYGRKKLN
jgi:hypothetical protein